MLNRMCVKQDYYRFCSIDNGDKAVNKRDKCVIWKGSRVGGWLGPYLKFLRGLGYKL